MIVQVWQIRSGIEGRSLTPQENVPLLWRALEDRQSSLSAHCSVRGGLDWTGDHTKNNATQHVIPNISRRVINVNGAGMTTCDCAYCFCHLPSTSSVNFTTYYIPSFILILFPAKTHTDSIHVWGEDIRIIKAIIFLDDMVTCSTIGERTAFPFLLLLPVLI